MTDPQEADRVVAGVVDAGGNIENGSGFTSVRTGVGRYIVVFRPPFVSIDGAAGTQVFDGSPMDTLTISVITPTELLVQTWDNRGGPVDRPFTFICTGSGSVPEVSY